MISGHVGDLGCPVLTERQRWQLCYLVIVGHDCKRGGVDMRRGCCYLATVGHVGDLGCPVLTDRWTWLPCVGKEGRLLPCDHWTCWWSLLSCLDCRRGGGAGLPGRRPGLATGNINPFYFSHWANGLRGDRGNLSEWRRKIVLDECVSIYVFKKYKKLKN